MVRVTSGALRSDNVVRLLRYILRGFAWETENRAVLLMVGKIFAREKLLQERNLGIAAGDIEILKKEKVSFEILCRI